MTVATAAQVLHLELNDTGAWRRVTSFNAADFDAGDLEMCAQHLLEMSVSQHLRARIIAPGSTAPLALWTRAEGWRDWERGVASK